MGKTKAEGAPAEKLAFYERLVATNPSVERKGAAMPYTSLNGHMFSFMTAEGALALRLPDGEREKFLAKYDSVLCEQHGAVLKEYVVVPDTLLAKTRELKKYFDLSLDYVGGLKPKATKKAAPKK